jgi:hypothetical protein
LSTSLSCNNFVLFTPEGSLKRYKDELEIQEEFFPVRYKKYAERKKHQLSVLKREMTILNNKRRFIESVNSGKIKPQNKTKLEVT